MTTDPRSPSSRQEHSSNADALQVTIDEWASRRLDGELGTTDIPDDVRAAVESRTREFGEQRARLLATPEAVGTSRRRDAHIAAALASVSSRQVPSLARFASARSFAVAASIVCVLAVSALALRTVGSHDDNALTDAVSVQGQMKNEQPAMERSSTEPVEANTAQASTGGLASDSLASTDSPVAPRTYASIEEIALAAAERASAAVAADASVVLCAEPTDRPHVAERALVVDRDVEIHFFADGTFSVYDIETCSVVDVSDTGR